MTLLIDAPLAGEKTRVVLDALQWLAARCDGATTVDGQGFNKPDSYRGKQLAARSWLNQEEAAEALTLLRKYQGQLDRGGIELPNAARVQAEAQYAETTSGTIRLRHDLLLVEFPYLARHVALIKTLKGARWDGANRIWTVPMSSGADLLAAFPGFKVKDDVRQAVADWQPSLYRGKLSLAKTQIVVTFEYDPDLVAAVKTVKGARFDGDTKVWRVPLEEFSALTKALPDFEVDKGLAAAVQAKADAAAELARKEAALSSTVVDKLDAVLDAPLPSGRTLFAHQKTGVKFLVEKRRAILADQMGTGKTITALMSARVLKLPVIVVCPVSLKINWQREAEMVGVTIETYSWAKVPEPPDHDFVLICDESHAIQSLRSQRTKSTLTLAHDQHCLACFLLTGTPIKNGRPANLYPLLAAVKHSLARDKRQFELYYCNAHATRFTQWDISGAAHLDELHKNTKDVMLRRTKDQCLDLPSKTLVVRGIELSKAAQERYDKRFEELRKEYQERIQKGEISSASDALVMFNHVLHAGSIAKVETAVEIAKEVVDEGSQIVLFVGYKESGNAIACEFGVKMFSGETPAVVRQQMVDRFQAGQDRVMVCTVGAGGEGITLTAAQTAVLVDRPWTPGGADQVADRLHRSGQKNAVTIIWLQYGEADTDRDALLQAKQERIDLVLAGKRKSMRGVTDPGLIAQTLLPDILG